MVWCALIGADVGWGTGGWGCLLACLSLEGLEVRFQARLMQRRGRCQQKVKQQVQLRRQQVKRPSRL